MNKSMFIQYLRDTLIPDLMASGMEETALDFAVAVLLLEGHEFATKEDLTLILHT